NGSNCSAGSGAGGVSALGAAEDCTDYEEDLLNSAGLLAALNDETGTSLAVFSNSPVFTDDFDLAAAGVRFAGADGVLTLLGLGDGNDENLTIDLDNAAANNVTVASGTGVTNINFTSIGSTWGGNVNIGANTLVGTAAVIDFSEFDVSGTDGSITINDGSDAGKVLVEGTNLDINDLTFVGAGTIASTSSALTLDSGSNTLVLAASDTTISRTASGTFTLDLVDGADTTFSITNSNAGGGIDALLKVDSLATGGASQCLEANSTGVIALSGSACGGGSGDSISVNSAAAADANFLDVAATGSVAGTAWTLVGASTPDDITLAISTASDSVAGIVNTSSQTFAGAKTFTSNLTVNKADSAIVFDTSTGTDTDFWLGVTDDGGTDDDDYFQIGDGTTPGTNPFLTLDTSGNTGIGVSLSLKTKLNVVGTVTTSGADAIATIYADSTLNNSTGSGFQFGQRFLNTISSSVAGTHVGTFIRMTDSTSLTTGQLVRGLEVQAYSGTNNGGINTGIASFGKTFGVHAETTAQAGAVAQPAAVFADLNNSSDGTLGNAIRAYTDNATSADLVSLYQETSTMTGTGLVMNFAAGSGTFSGNFADFQKNSVSKFKVDDTGTTTIAIVDADNAKAVVINTEESSVDTVNIFEIQSDTTNNSQSVDTVKAHFDTDGSLFVSFTGTQTSSAVCHTGSGMANNDEIVDCTGTP
ncbi:MAG: hypothetical protein KW804_03590, partial [Candidatus Doudnabacteria bacterium]|nr:hypothetical protein [Candidatus Doudnabacteria bacterium]